MIARAASLFWNRSPAELFAALRRKAHAARDPKQAPLSPYGRWLLETVHEFLSGKYREATLPREAFVELFLKHQRSGIIRPANVYIGDLWELFAPDYRARFPEYYRSQDLQLMMTFLGYALDTPALHANYAVPYRLARERLKTLNVLEVGAGVPHGFLYTVFESGAGWCKGLHVVDLDAIYSEFTQWFAERSGVPYRRLPALAARAPVIEGGSGFDFVFAKDVFEHLDAPETTIDSIVRAAAPAATLALDLQDRGAVEYQHISPRLSHHSRRVEQHGFRPRLVTGNLTIFER